MIAIDSQRPSGIPVFLVYIDILNSPKQSVGLRRHIDQSAFTSEDASSILSENVLNVTRTQCSTHMKRVSQHFVESHGFSPGAPVSSHSEVDRVG